MLAVHLVKTYCLLVLLYGSETWSLSSSDKYMLNVAWNNCFCRISNGFWRESVKPLLFHCNTMPFVSIADQRRLTFLRNITCGTNLILSTLGRLCDYDFRALAAVYNINCVHVNNSYIKSAGWSSFAECL